MCRIRVCCSVYGLEFVGDSWKHNAVFGWHVWILISCCILLIGLDLVKDIQSGLQRSARALCGFADVACCRHESGPTTVAKLWLNGCGVLYFNCIKLANLSLGLCDVEYMAEHFREFGVSGVEYMAEHFREFGVSCRRVTGGVWRPLCTMNVCDYDRS